MQFNGGEKNMKKPIKLALASLLLVGGMSSLAACNKDNFNGLTINFWHTFGQTVTDGVAKKAADFAAKVLKEENFSLRINLVYKGGYEDVKGEVEKGFGVGGNPTIAVAYPDHVADYLAIDGNYVVNLKPFIDDETIGLGKESYLGDTHSWEDIIESFREESSNYIKEGVYSMPFLKSSEVMLYNFDLVKKAMPYWDSSIITDDDIKDRMKDLSWDDFMDFCEVIVDNKNAIDPDLEAPCFYDSDANLFITKLKQNNKVYAGIKENGAGYIGFNGLPKNNPTPEQIAEYEWTQGMLKEYKEWYNKKLFTTKGVEGVYSSNWITTKKSIFAIGSTGGSGYSFPATNEFTLGACMVPYSNNNPVYVTQGPTLTVLNNINMIKAGTNDDAVKYAWKFIKYLTNEKVNADLCTTNSEGYVPVRTSAYSTTEFINFLNSKTQYVLVAKVIVEDMQHNYFSTPAFKGSANLRDQVAGCFADVMKLSKTLSDDDLEAAIKVILDRTIDQSVPKM